MLNTFIKQAFDKICTEQVEPDYWYVSLVELCPYYGGPEEGGWWGTDTHLVAFQQYPSKELAEAASTKIQVLAKELSTNAQRSYGEQCLRETEWLEARGLDDSFLPAPDGPSEYRVYVSEQLPTERRGSRQYS